VEYCISARRSHAARRERTGPVWRIHDFCGSACDRGTWLYNPFPLGALLRQHALPYCEFGCSRHYPPGFEIGHMHWQFIIGLLFDKIDQRFDRIIALLYVELPFQAARIDGAPHSKAMRRGVPRRRRAQDTERASVHGRCPRNPGIVWDMVDQPNFLAYQVMPVL
jgi:hypothetical protein